MGYWNIIIFEYWRIWKKQKESENNNSTNNFYSNNHLIKLKEKEINFESSKSITSIRLNINRRKSNNNSLKNQNNENNSKENIINQNVEIYNDNHDQKTMKTLKEEKNIESNNKSIKLNIHKLDFNFYDYMYYNLKCGKNKVDLKIFNDFRTKIISEENIIKNYLNMYFLLKINQECFLDCKNRFKFEDLINVLKN